MPLAPGLRFGHYEIVSSLGAGGMGEVFKAKDTRLGREVALKVLRPDALANPDRKQRFLREAQATSALNHPNIVVVYEVGAEDGIDFIAMEYVRGKTLDQLIPRKGLRCAEALKYGVAIADALAKAHGAGVVHRDLKPGNIMVNDDGHVKVLDFGLAKIVEASPIGVEEATRTLREPTEDGAILGTISYMSPEQAEGKPIDARSDIFSFGAVLYEMVAGQKAFHGDSKLSTLSAILREDPKPVSEIVEDIPREVERIIARCLRKDTERRFQHMSDLKVELQEVKEESDSGMSQSGQAAVRPRSGRPVYVAGVALVLIAAAGGYWKFFRSPPLAPTRVTPFTTFAGSETAPAFSPDGKLMAYSWDGPNQDNFDIYVQQIGAGSPLRLTTDPGYDFGPVFSPDGRYIAFARGGRGGAGSLILVPALGGPERKVSQVRGSIIDFSPNGKTIAITDSESESNSLGIFLVSVETGARKRLTSPSGTSRDGSPRFSPDGETIAFVRNLAVLISELHVVPVNGGESKRLSEDIRIAGLAWMPDGRGIVFASIRPGTPMGLWRVAASGGASVPVPEGGEGSSLPAISRDGRRLAYNRQITDTNIWRAELSPPGSPVKLIASTRQDGSPRYSPDGKRIVFFSDRSGSEEIWICNADGSSPAQLTSLASAAGTPRWSPDGHRIAFDARVRGNADIYVIDADGGSPRRLTTDPAEDNLPSWSSDGKWIYFSTRRTGAFEIWRIPADGGKETQITHRGGFEAQESPNGGVLFYTKDNTSGIWRIPVEGGTESPAIGSATVAGHNNWQPFDDGIYFLQRMGTGSRRSAEALIQFFDFSTGKIVTMGRVEKAPYTSGGFSVSPDRRQVIFSHLDQNDSDIMLVENFR